MNDARQDESDELHRRVRAFIASPPASESSGFDGLALAIAGFQAKHVATFARLVRSAGVDLDRATSADAIPAMVTDAFRFARVAAHPPAADVRVFQTSGTTRGELRGAHPFRTTETYEASLLAWGRAMLLLGEPIERGVILCPPSIVAADSSLSFMLDRFTADLPPARVGHFVDPVQGVDIEGVIGACGRAREEGAATLVAGTSFAFVHLVDGVDPGADLSLPAGSRVMTTGGTKGRSREVDAATLRRELAVRFGVPASHVIGEYGMTELSSQLYEPDLAVACGALLTSGDRWEAPAYLAPPWLRVTAVDPEDFRPLPEGQMGIARFVDLANVDSAVAIQTADRVRIVAGRVELWGRQPGAPPRGCSLALEHLFGASPT